MAHRFMPLLQRALSPHTLNYLVVGVLTVGPLLAYASLRSPSAVCCARQPAWYWCVQPSRTGASSASAPAPASTGQRQIGQSAIAATITVSSA